MRLSLSVRVAESSENKRELGAPFSDIVSHAVAAGYEALCMRASVVGVHSPPGEAERIRAQLDDAGLAVSMVTADFAVPENGDEGPASLRNITPSLDLAETLGADLIRVCIKTGEDLDWAARAADEAAERNIRLAHQSHMRSLFEIVDDTLESLRRIDRPNFGLIYEPGNLSLCGADYGPETIKAFSPWLFNVYVQNHTPDPDGDVTIDTWNNGSVLSRIRPLDAPGGIDFDRVFEGLRAVGYTGTVTMHQPYRGAASAADAIAATAAFLRHHITG